MVRHEKRPKVERQNARPAAAIRTALPKILKPQLATLVKSPPQDSGWTYEVKFDGYRLLARISSSGVRLFTRNGNDWTGKLPLLVNAIKLLDLKSAWLDGEIVMVDKNGLYNFQELQNAFEKERTSHIQFFLFDLPYFDGYDLRKAPLSERRSLLRQVLMGSQGGPLHFSEDLSGSGQQILTEACRLGLEGVIGKRKDAPYVSARSPSWIKLKCQQRQEFVVVGFTDPQGAREKFGALMLGIYGEDGALRYVGRVGTGFDSKLLHSLHTRLKTLEIEAPAFANPPRGSAARGAHWVKPVIVAEVSFAPWTEDGMVRHAVFHASEQINRRRKLDARALSL
jgi:bifunctional non-homologous end joining protein LigD